MRQHGLLFSEGDLRTALESHATSIEQEVEKAPEEHLLQADENEWVSALVERYRVEAPVLDADRRWMDASQEVKVDVAWDHWRRAITDPSRPTYVPGHRVVVHVPFSGEADVFRFRPSTFNWNPPAAEIRGNEVIQVIEYPDDTPADVKAESDDLIRGISEFLRWAHNDVEQMNSGLEQRARNAIRARRERVRANYDRLATTGIPMQRPDSTPKTYIAEAVTRRPSPSPPPRNAEVAIPLEPVLSDAVFDHILEVIRATGEAMERSPNTYSDMGEEDRRQVLLAALNTHYRGQATAEAFNVTGKTDLLVRHEGRNLFIGECKFWSGPKSFTDAVNQLFGYAAWRDTKLTVAMFVGERDLTSVVDKARDQLAAHPRFVEWKDAGAEAELRATMTWPGDQRRFADLNVFFIHTPRSN